MLRLPPSACAGTSSPSCVGACVQTAVQWVVAWCVLADLPYALRNAADNVAANASALKCPVDTSKQEGLGWAQAPRLIDHTVGLLTNAPTVFVRVAAWCACLYAHVDAHVDVHVDVWWHSCAGLDMPD